MKINLKVNKGKQSRIVPRTVIKLLKIIFRNKNMKIKLKNY